MQYIGESKQRQDRVSGRERRWGWEKIDKLGDDLRSQAVTHQVPSALASLTTGFEMGPGIPSLLKTPRKSILTDPQRTPHAPFRQVMALRRHTVKIAMTRGFAGKCVTGTPHGCGLAHGHTK